MSIFTVTELTHAIKKTLEGTFRTVRVKGEVSSLKRQASGHIYFTLKDAEAQISAVLFQGNTRSLERLPKDGDQLIVDGELSVYPPRGNYQLIIRSIQYDGLGNLLLQLHQLKTELQDLGYFAKERKRPLPVFPKTIGVVTSPTGAVIQDIITVLKRRLNAFHLILHPVKVQGAGAAQEIASAIETFNRDHPVDVLIVGRGGGSLEDLWPFNERCVADAIFASKIPVISAVGHETDFSISDFVADVRAPTPSAAAEIVSKETALMTETVTRAKQQLASSLRHLLELSYQKLDDKQDRAKRALMTLVRMQKMKLTALSKHLYAIHPKVTLKKGYCICFSENSRSAIMSSGDIHVSQNLSLLFYDGEVDAIATKVRHEV